MTETIETETNAPVIEPEAAEPAVDAANATTPIDPSLTQNITDAANSTPDPAALIDAAKETLTNAVTDSSTTDGVGQLVGVLTDHTESLFTEIARVLNNAANYLSPDIIVPYLEKLPFIDLFPPHTYATMILIVVVSFIIWRGGCLAKWLFSIALLILGVMFGLDIANYLLV